jgi:hypothetical protein
MLGWAFLDVSRSMLALLIGFGSCITSSEEPPLSNFNSYRECAGELTNDTRVQVPPDEGRSRPVGTESCGRRGNARSEA